MEMNPNSTVVISQNNVPGLSWISRKAGSLIEELVRQAGIEIGRELIVNDPSMWCDWASKGMLGIGESYMLGKWDSPHLDLVMGKLASMPSEAKKKLFSPLRNKALIYCAMKTNPQKPSRELEVARRHYDLGNEFFAAWLDPHMQYSCAYWKGATTLEEAQIAKMKLLAGKLDLKPGLRVLDIGCGWGGTRSLSCQGIWRKSHGHHDFDGTSGLVQTKSQGRRVGSVLRGARNELSEFERGMGSHRLHRHAGTCRTQELSGVFQHLP